MAPFLWIRPKETAHKIIIDFFALIVIFKIRRQNERNKMQRDTNTKPGETITHDAMETYFKTLLTEK